MLKNLPHKIMFGPLAVGIISGVLVNFHYEIFLSHGSLATVFVPGLLYGIMTFFLLRSRFTNTARITYLWIAASTVSFICAFFVAVFLIGTADRGADYMAFVALAAASVVGTGILYIGFRYAFHRLDTSNVILLFVLPVVFSIIYPLIRNSPMDGHLLSAELFLFITWQTTVTLVLSKYPKKRG